MHCSVACLCMQVWCIVRPSVCGRISLDPCVCGDVCLCTHTSKYACMCASGNEIVNLCFHVCLHKGVCVSIRVPVHSFRHFGMSFSSSIWGQVCIYIYTVYTCKYLCACFRVFVDGCIVWMFVCICVCMYQEALRISSSARVFFVWGYKYVCKHVVCIGIHSTYGMHACIYVHVCAFVHVSFTCI